MSRTGEFVLTLSCRDTKGIVHAVSGLLFQAGCNIIDSQQYGDLVGPGATGRFFMRVHFEAPPQLADVATLDRMLSNVREQFAMEAQLHALARRPRQRADRSFAPPWGRARSKTYEEGAACSSASSRSR